MAQRLYYIQLLVARVVEPDLRTTLHNQGLKFHVPFTSNRIRLNLCMQNLL